MFYFSDPTMCMVYRNRPPSGDQAPPLCPNRNKFFQFHFVDRLSPDRYATTLTMGNHERAGDAAVMERARDNVEPVHLANGLDVHTS